MYYLISYCSNDNDSILCCMYTLLTVIIYWLLSNRQGNILGLNTILPPKPRSVPCAPTVPVGGRYDCGAPVFDERGTLVFFFGARLRAHEASCSRVISAITYPYP